jgi:Cof subfamily protein (haloacid dehalogenase superfamily)
MSAVRLLALDLDDTVLRSDLTISPRTRDAIRQVEAAGIMVVLASGRVPAAMEPHARVLDMHKRPGYLICNNGTIIQETHAGEIVYESGIEAGIALLVFDLANAEGFPAQVYEGNVIYISSRNEYSDYDQKLTGLKQMVAENFRDMLKNGCNKLLIPGDPAFLASLESILRCYLGDEITLFTSKPYFLEILPPCTDKGTALEKVAGFLGIEREEVLAIGDSMNDETMLRWAGTGVAMANSDARIKNIADFVGEKDNDNDGVAEIIEKYILTKQVA